MAWSMFTSFTATPLELMGAEPLFIVSWIIKWKNALRTIQPEELLIPWVSEQGANILQYSYVMPLHFKVLVKTRKYSSMWENKVWTSLNGFVSKWCSRVSMENAVLSLEGFLSTEFIGIMFGGSITSPWGTCDIAFALLQQFVLRCGQTKK